MSILRSLLVTLGMNSAQYRNDLEKSKKKTKTDYKEMAGAAASFAAKSAAAFASTAIAMASANAKMIRDQSNMANVAQMTLDQYQKMSFAAEQYGVSAEQVADISKDTLEKIGEYINAGSGGLQDFADAMGMTKEETLKWAKSVQGMSGQQIFQKMINEMEAVGLSSEQMSNALESLGSDATKLIPLFSNNGKELERLSEKYSRFNEELTPDKIAQYKQAAEDIDLMTKSIQNMATIALVPVIEKIYETGKAWQWLMASLNEGTVEQITSEMADLVDANKKLRTEISYLENRGYDNFFQNDAEDAAELTKELEKNIARYDELQQQLIKLQGIDLPEIGFKRDDPLELKIKPTLHKTAFEKELDPEKTFYELYGGTDTVDLFSLNLAKKNSALAESLAKQLALESESMDERYNREINLLQQSLSDYDQFLEAKSNLDKRYAQQKQASEIASMQAVLSATESFSSAMLGIMNEESEGYKAMFLISQAAAFANAMVAANLAYAQVLAHDAGIMGMGAVASAEMVRGLGYASAAAIAGQSIAGVFHGGGAIPENNGEQTYLLKGGEYVESQAERRKIDKMLSGNGVGNGNGSVININVSGNIYGDKETRRIMEQAAQMGAQLVGQDARSNGPIYKQMRR